MPCLHYVQHAACRACAVVSNLSHHRLAFLCLQTCQNSSISKSDRDDIVSPAWAGTAAKIGAISAQQACSRCCCFFTRSWHPATFNQQILHHRWTGSKPKRHLHIGREMSATQPGRNCCALQGTAAGLSGHVAAMWGSSGTTDVALPADKLSATLPHDKDHHPVILVNCGSFNPPTIMHLRMFDVAAQVLEKAGYDVLGGYMSPVNDAYHKPGLLPAQHRVAMCQLAAAESDLIMVDTWEAAQPDAQRSLVVLDRVQQAVQDHYSAAGHGQQQPEGPASSQAKYNSRDQYDPAMQDTAGTSGSSLAALEDMRHQHQKPQVRAMLVCGADVLESFVKPGVWVEEQVRRILGDHGVVCIARNSQGLDLLLQKPGTLLSEFRNNIHVTQDPATAGISSTHIRGELGQGNTVKFLTPNSVINYIQHHGLYA